MNYPRLRTATGITLSVLLGTGAMLVSPIAASAAGVGDQTDAVLYNADGPIGDVLTELSNSDDDSTTVAAPFPINFFGETAGALCISTNGTIVPVPTVGDSCGDDYDVDLATFAVDNQESVIGALLADLDPSEELYQTEAPDVAIVDVQIASEIVTFETAAPHGYSAGSFTSIDFAGTHPIFGGGVSGVIASVPDATHFTFDFSGSSIPDTAGNSYAGTAQGAGTEYEDTNSDGLADDGFGNVKQIYAGTTTVDGKPAFAITWYRVPTNDDENPSTLSNTFQVVFIQEPTTNGDTVGYDFSVQFNFGTLTDGNDGYEIGSDGSASCDSEEPETCAWSVGWARYDSGTDTAEEYEFFADVPVTDLIDGAGATALVNNRLNSDVYGRYMMSMFGGVTVGYSVPVLVGRDAAPAQLPNTGVDASGLIAASGLLLLIGAALVIARRRQASEQA